MYRRTRVWLGENESNQRLRHVLSAVIDVYRSSRTGKEERYYYHFMENSFGKRRFVVNGSREAYATKAWTVCPFQKTADDWKAGQMDTETLKRIIDEGIKNGVQAGLCHTGND